GTDFQPQRADLVGNDAGAQHPARRAVKGGEYAIAGRLDLTAAIAREIAADRGVMIVEKIAPAAVAQLSSLLSRADDVGEENRSQHPIGRHRRARTGQELLDGIGHLGNVVTDKRHVVDSRELEVAGTGDMFGKIASTLTLDCR